MIQVGCTADFDIAEVRPIRDAFAAWAAAGYLGGRGEKFLTHLVFGEEGPVGEDAQHACDAMLQFLDAGQVAFLAVVDKVVEFAFVLVREMHVFDSEVESLDQRPASIIAQVAVDNHFLSFPEGQVQPGKGFSK